MTGLDPDLLADLDAGLLEPAHAAQVRAAALADPRSAAVLDALRSTRAELAALPTPAVPPDVAQRWSAALAAATDPPPPRVHDPDTVRPGIEHGVPARRWAGRRWAATLVAAAAVVALVVGGLLSGPDGRQDVTGVQLVAVARSTIGQDDLGPLTDPARRAACLATAGHPGAEVLGGRQVRLDGVPGVLLVLPTGVLGRFRVLVVDEACRPLAQDVYG